MYWRISLACRWELAVAPRSSEPSREVPVPLWGRFVAGELAIQLQVEPQPFRYGAWSPPSASPRPWAVFEDSNSETIYSLILSRSFLITCIVCQAPGTQRQMRQDSCSETSLPIQTNRPVNTGPSKSLQKYPWSQQGTVSQGQKGDARQRLRKQQVVSRRLPVALHRAVWVKGIQLGGYWLGRRGRKSTPEHLDRAHRVLCCCWPGSEGT